MADYLLRSYQAGDERQTAALFNQCVAGFIGPFVVTPEVWLGQYRKTWRSPGLEVDPDCVRVAVRGEQIIGHCAADYDDGEMVSVLELCVAPGPEAAEVAQALLADVEARARERGKAVVVLQLSDEDGLAQRLAAANGYEAGASNSVFMATITDLEGFLQEIAPELTRRLGESTRRDWTGSISLRSGELAAGLYLEGGRVEVARVTEAQVEVEIDPEALPLLLLGRLQAGPAYLQDVLTVKAKDGLEALRLLDVLFPRRPLFLPRPQWW
jgi:hypothetical protein